MNKLKPKVVVLTILLIALIGVSANLISQKIRSNNSKAASTVSIRVSGNSLVNGFGKPVRLIGVDVFSTSYACLKGTIEASDDPPLDQATITTMLSWHINAVRIPLNEDCWLGINGAPASASGAAYQSAISNFVSLLNQNGLVAVLDLHWGAPGSQLANAQEVMADADNAPTYWKSLAGSFKNDPGVLFDAYNEPEEISWSCWLNGCQVNDKNFGTYKAVGMQGLVDAIRSTGAGQPILLGGIGYSSDLSYWLKNEPTDPDNQLAASFHNYPDFSCNTSTCWDSEVAPVAAQVPVVTTELGDNECTPDFLTRYMSWADSHGVSYLGWSWNVNSNGCSSHLLSNVNGAASTDGAVYKTYLAGLWQAGDIVNFATNTAQPPSLGNSPPTQGGGGGGSSGTSGSSSGTSSKSSSTSSSSTSSGKSGSTTKSGSPISSTNQSSSSNSSTGNGLAVNPSKTNSSKAKTEHDKAVDAYVGSGILVIILGLCAAYWLVIVRQGNRLKIIRTKPPFYFKFEIHSKYDVNNVDNSDLTNSLPKL